MKKVLFSLLSFFVAVSFISCKEYTIAGTYSEESPSPEYESRIKIRINSDNSIESFFDGEWHDVGIAKFNKKNRNFIVSDGSKYFEFGFLSDDGRVLFVGVGIAFAKENESIQNIWGSAYSSDDIKVKFTENHSFEVLQSDGIWENIGDVLLDEKTGNFPVYDFNPLTLLKNSDTDTVYPVAIGLFSDDKKTLYLSDNCYALKKEEIDVDKKLSAVEKNQELPNPKLTFDSIDVCGISFKSNSTDLIFQYPDARIINKAGCKQYLVDGLENFDYIRFDYNDNALVHILKYKSEGEYDKGVSEIVHKSVKDLTQKYGKPEIEESSYEIPSYKVTKNTRSYTWYGEVFIKLKYEWNSDEYGHTSYGTCNVDYALSVLDLGW